MLRHALYLNHVKWFNSKAMLRSLLFTFFLLGQIISFAQGVEQDTVVWLENLDVRGLPQDRYAVGSPLQAISKEKLQQMQSQSLGQTLMTYSPVYIRSYGHQMLSTISFRGTHANHTALLWDGVNLSMPSLGMADFSNFPIFFFEGIGLQPGPASALYGSGALGGTIFLQNQAEKNTGWHLEAQQHLGSFQTFFSGIKGGYNGSKASFRIKAFHQQSANDFPFENTTRLGSPIERQQNAAVNGQGLMTEGHLQTGKKQHLEWSYWYTDWHRQIQPTMTSRFSQDWQADQSHRARLVWKYADRSWDARAGAYFLQDQINYNGSISTTYRWVKNAQVDRKLNENWRVHAGYQGQYITADISNYAEGTNEFRHDVFASLLWLISSKTEFAINLRQAWITGFQVPFTPSLGMSTSLNQSWKWTVLVAKTYRAPTLNERFWQPGGNPEISPEEGVSVETGLHWEQKSAGNLWKAGGSIYSQWVDNWILWRPTAAGFWAPENIRKVWARGAELQLNWHRELHSHLSLDQQWQYTFNRSGYQGDEQFKGTQLIYVPLHMGIYHSRLNFHRWFVEMQWIYTGERFTTADNLRSLRPYFLINGGLGTEQAVRNGSVQLLLRGNNLSNSAYQNYEFRAMPGIHGNLSLIYRWNQ